jgi:hypothetical protein
VNSDEGQDGHDNDHKTDKIDNVVHETLPEWMGPNGLLNKRAIGGGVPQRWGSSLLT